MTQDDITLGCLKLSNPKAYKAAMLHMFIDSYEDFLDILYTRLERAISDIQKHPNHYGDMNEDQITQVLISILRSNDLNAFSDPDTGGHVDLCVDYPGTEYLWLGEAKIDLNHGHVYEGFQQLTTRYATAARDQTEGGVLLYIKDTPAVDFLDATKEQLNQRVEHTIEFCECTRWPEQSFLVKTPTKRMGGNTIYNVRYIGISLYFLPEDKSGRKSQKYQEKRAHIEQKQQSTTS